MKGYIGSDWVPSCQYLIMAAMKQVYRFCVEGNIGAGKSTFLTKLTSMNPHIHCEFEKLDDWTNCNGTNLLELMYFNPAKGLFPFQSFAITTMAETLHQPLKQFMVVERSLDSIKNCFLPLAEDYNMLSMTEIYILQRQLTLANRDIEISGRIYLQTDPEECLKRIQKRNRSEESNLDLSRLIKLHELHEQWLLNDPSVTIVNSQSSYEMALKTLSSFNNFIQFH